MANLSALTIVTINDTDLPVIEFQGMRVLTFKLIDQIHRKEDGAARRNFSNNREYFIENEDFFEVSRGKLFSDISRPSPQSEGNVWENLGFEPKAPSGILITEEGYLLLVKSFNDDLAWQIQRKLKKAYFRTANFGSEKLGFGDYCSGIKLLDHFVDKLVHCRSLYQRNFLTWHIIKLSDRLNQPLPDIKLLGQPVSQTDLYLTNFAKED